MFRRKVTALAVLVATALLGACGGGGGDSSSSASSSSTSTLTGVAASGFPINGTVQVTDVNKKQKKVKIKADGSYSIDVSDLTAPFVLLAEGTAGGKTVAYAAPATAADIGKNLNITPFSDLMLANIAHGVAANCAASASCMQSLTQANITTQVNDLAAKLAPTLKAMGLDAATDLLHVSLTAGSHSGVDGLLDVLDISIDTSTKKALVKNLVANTSTSDDLTSSNDNSATLAAGSGGNSVYGTSQATILAEVRARMNEISAIMVSSDSADTKRTKLKAFCTADFLFSGKNCDDFLAASNFIDTSPTINAIAYFDQTAVNSADLTKLVDDQHVAVLLTDTRMFAMLFRKGGDGKYYWAGDQMSSHFYLGVNENYQPNMGANPYSALELNFRPGHDAQGNVEADTVEVTGPGLASVVVLVPNSSHDWFMVQGKLETTNNIYEGEYNYNQMVAGVASATPYVLTLKKAGAVVAVYKRTLGVAPIKNSDLTVAMFPTVANLPTLSLCQNGGTWTPNVSNASDLLWPSTYLECQSSNATGGYSIDADGFAAISVPATANSSSVYFQINGTRGGRNFSFGYWTNQ